MTDQLKKKALIVWMSLDLVIQISLQLNALSVKLLRKKKYVLALSKNMLFVM
jgi:hypothetical protein